MMIKLSAAILASLLLSACVVGPDYEKPKATIPDSFMAQDVLTALNQHSVAKQSHTDDWWTGFDDTLLNQLVSAGIEHSYVIAAATSRVQVTQERVRIAAANNKLSINSGISSSADKEKSLKSSARSTTLTRNTASLSASLFLDVFGRNQRTIEAAQAALEASLAELRGSLLTTSADIAAEYLTLRGNQRQLELLKESVTLQEKTLAVVRARFNAGLAPELDLQRALASVERLSARIPPP